jgi:hypothetical protein
MNIAEMNDHKANLNTSAIQKIPIDEHVAGFKKKIASTRTSTETNDCDDVHLANTPTADMITIVNPTDPLEDTTIIG